MEKNATVFAQLIQCLDDKSLSLVIQGAYNQVLFEKCLFNTKN